MKFDKKEWRVHILSPNNFVSQSNQKLKFFIADTIANTAIQSARVKISTLIRPDRTSPTGGETIYLDWTPLTLVDNFYEADININVVITEPIITSLKIEITEEDSTLDFANEIPITIRGA